MKNLFALPIFFLLMINTGNAQSASTDEDGLVQKIWGKAMQELTSSALQLDQQEADGFWPLWNEYREERRKNTDAKLQYIADYANAYENMTNEKAAAITSGLLKNEKQLLKIKSKYFKKIKKKVSALRAAQFIQLEATIDNELRSFITQSLPLMPDPIQ